MQTAVDVIVRHLDRGSTIFVHGDYDVDGITATATLVSFFRFLKASCSFYIPDRISDGYGLSDTGIDRAIQTGSSLVITVDCGISAFDAVDRLSDCGIETVVTDHHECKDRLPDRAASIVNPKQPDETYPFRNLSGAGVALKLVHALCIRLGLGEHWREYLDFASLGTLADVMCLTSENRALVSFGIEKIQRRCNTGLNAMLRQINQDNRPVTSALIGFTVAPRLNAAGRMGDASRAVELLLTDDPLLADRLAAALNEDNQKRKDLENDILTEARRPRSTRLSTSAAAMSYLCTGTAGTRA